MSDLKCGEAVEPCGVDGFWRDVGNVGDEIFQVFTCLLQVGGIDNDLNQLQNTYIT